MGDEHGVTEELEEGPEDRLDPRSVAHDRVGQPGEHGDLRRDRPAGVDQGVEGAEALSTAELDHADLGDHVVGAIAAGGLEVEHAERGLAQRCAEFVEAALERECRPAVRRPDLGRCRSRTA